MYKIKYSGKILRFLKILVRNIKIRLSDVKKKSMNK